jgi:hypothetical protein
MFRSYDGIIDITGTGSVTIFHNNAAMEWDIYQVSVSCGVIGASCIVQLSINGAFLCATPQGSLDTATGPPDIVLNSSDVLVVTWKNGMPLDAVVANVWYNENPVNTTYSSAH